MKKILIAATAIIALSATSTFAAENSLREDLERPEQGKIMINKKEWLKSDAIQAAIKANDYDAFVKAFNAESDKITTPNQDEFAKIVTRFKEKPVDSKSAPLQAAIKANDYDAFVTAFKTLKPSNVTENVIPSKEEFVKLVDMAKKHEAVQAAIKANDYTAFVTAFNANKPIVPTSTEFTKIVELQKTIKDNKEEIKNTRDERKEGTITKNEAKTEIKSIKEENEAVKKAARLAKRPLRKVSRLSK